jgi:ABC-2 type transport system ATP-binding protein
MRPSERSGPELAIETAALRKVYGGWLRRRPFVAVDSLDLEVPRGQVFGFLGPNGAGKTTTIMMLLGNTSPSAGKAWLLGRPIGDVESRRRLGFLPEKFQFHDFLQADEFLDLHGKLYGMPAAARREAAEEALKRVGLWERRRDRLRQFSKGMQQRIGLAQALLNRPELVILDEPTSALDPIGRRQVRDIVLDLKERGTTVFLNSHLLSEIELTCDRVAILNRGRLLRQGTIEELLAPVSRVEVRLEALTEPVRAAMERFGPVQANGASATVEVREEGRVPDLAAAIIASGGRLQALIPHRETLEDMFVRVVEGTVPEVTP